MTVHIDSPRHGAPTRSPVVAEVAEHLRRYLDGVTSGVTSWDPPLDPVAHARMIIDVVRRDGPAERLWVDALQGVLHRLLDAIDAREDGMQHARRLLFEAFDDARELLDDLARDGNGA